ncbi:GTP binding [Euphorbia peplus]|nr:GTP binding [Euphorbia peplus]
MESSSDPTSLENRPGIFFTGSSNVGKRTLLSRLLSVDIDDASDSSSEVVAYGWTLDTKYYSADVSVWMSHLRDGFSIQTLPIYSGLSALVMVFDMNDLASLVALQDWVSRTDIHKFEVLLCIGNKVDLIPGHPVHAEYRRRLLKLEDSSADPYSEVYDYGISETEGNSLLGGEEPPLEIRRSCLEWCTEHNIEYIEACGSNAEFDKCLSADGDLQGVERLLGALSAHMWPGMVLKSGKSVTLPVLRNKEDFSEEDSEYEFEYEVLSAGSAEPFDDTNIEWISANGTGTLSSVGASSEQINHVTECDVKDWEKFDEEELQPSTSAVELHDDKEAKSNAEDPNKDTEINEVSPFDLEDLEQLMSGIGNMRDNLRLMPDYQRKEMAADLAMKMATMFGGGSDDEEELNV